MWIKWIIEAVNDFALAMTTNEYIAYEERENTRCFTVQGTEKLSNLKKAQAEQEMLLSCVGEGQLERERQNRLRVLKKYIYKRRR